MACTLVRRALAPYNFSRRKHEETEGFLTYRIADRRGDHSDHRGHRYSEFAQGQDGGKSNVNTSELQHPHHLACHLLLLIYSSRLRRYFGCTCCTPTGIPSSPPT